MKLLEELNGMSRVATIQFNSLEDMEEFLLLHNPDCTTFTIECYTFTDMYIVGKDFKNFQIIFKWKRISQHLILRPEDFLRTSEYG